MTAEAGQPPPVPTQEGELKLNDFNLCLCHFDFFKLLALQNISLRWIILRRFMCSEMKIVWKERQILDKYVSYDSEYWY